MSKIIVTEFDVCDKFFNEIKHVFSQQFGKFSMTHNVFDTDFTIFIEYNAGLFNIDNMIMYKQDSPNKSDLHTYHWKAHRRIEVYFFIEDQ